MLAEGKKKVKYSLNPNGAEWANDSSKLGQRLIEKMGWSSGKGLGKREDGRVEHVKVDCKSDKRGIGCSLTRADQLSSHQDEFQAVLANLAAIHNNDDKKKDNDDNDSSEFIKKKNQFSNLSETAKSSYTKSRYHKFIQSKNLSIKTQEEMNCVFGIKKNINNKSGGDDDDGKESMMKKSKTYSEGLSSLNESVALPESGLKTSMSSSNMSDYFAAKMAKLNATRASKGGKGAHDDDDNNKTGGGNDNYDGGYDNDRSGCPNDGSEEGDKEEKIGDDSLVESKKTKRKKDKKKKKGDDDKVKFIIASNDAVEEKDAEVSESKKEKRRKRRAEKDKSDLIGGEGGDRGEVVVENMEGENELVLEKKKNKAGELFENDEKNKSKKNKKKRRRENERNSNDEKDDDYGESNDFEKKKAKMKNYRNLMNVSEEASKQDIETNKNLDVEKIQKIKGSSSERKTRKKDRIPT